MIIIFENTVGFGECCTFTSPYTIETDEVENDFIPSVEWMFNNPTTTKGGDVFIDASCHSEDENAR